MSQNPTRLEKDPQSPSLTLIAGDDATGDTIRGMSLEEIQQTLTSILGALRIQRVDTPQLMTENKPTRDPRQDLKVGDIVRFERTGVITDRQTGGIVKDHDGNDFEPVQYVIRETLSGNKSFVPCNQILTVIGKEEE